MEVDYNEKDWVTPCPKYDCKKTACKCGLEYVNIPMSLGDDSEGSNAAPKNGAYCNALVFYEANGHVYIYTKEGVPTLIDVDASDISTLEQEVIKAQKDVHELSQDIGDFIYGFNTVADMKNADNLNSGDIVRTLGYYAKNDGGGAWYKIVGTTPSGYYETLNSGLYAQIITDEEVYPEQFGAYGDGTHDDAPAIRTAMSYISGKGGGTIILSDGKIYILNSLINPSSTVTSFFDVPDNTIIRGSGTLKIADNFGDYDCVFRPTSALNRLEFRDFTLDDNTTGNPMLETTGGTEGHHRTGFRLISQPTKQVIMDNITFNDCIGVWQVIIEKTINAEFSNLIINFNAIETPEYDQTSIFFGALHGSVHGCKLYGNGKARTCIELHGIDNSLYSTMIDNYRNGVYMTNETIVDENVYRQEVYSNTIKTRKTGIKYWMIHDNISAELISAHHNLVEVEGGVNDPDSIGIGLHTAMGNGASVNDLMVNNNTITMKDNTNDDAIALAFKYSGTTNSSTIRNLSIRNNIVYGNVEYAVQIRNEADDALKIFNTTVDGNEFNISSTNPLFHVVAHSGFDYIFFTNNIIKADNIYQIYGIYGSPDCQTFISDNNCDKTMVARYVAGDSVTGVKVEHDNVYLNSGTLFNALPASVMDGSVFKTDKYTCVKADGRWTVNGSSEIMPTHQWFGKGSVINLTNDTDIMAIAKKDGYVADHDMSTGDHKLGDWVKYGLYVWYCKIDNTYTDDPSTHPDEFQYIGESCTFYTISAT